MCYLSLRWASQVTTFLSNICSPIALCRKNTSCGLYIQYAASCATHKLYFYCLPWDDRWTLSCQTHIFQSFLTDMAWVQQLLYYTVEPLFKWHCWIKDLLVWIKTLAQVPDINHSMKTTNDVWGENIYRKVKRPTVTRSQTQDTLGLSRQCFAH